MPEHLRALIVIVILATAVFSLASKTATQLISARDFKRRRNLWFTLTLLAFLAHSFWLYAAAATFCLLMTRRQEHAPLALFFLLLFVMPPATMQIPGFGLINYLIEFDHTRLLALAILLPAFFVLQRQPGVTRFGRPWPDRLLLAYLLLVALLHLRGTTLTDTFRQTFYLFIDVFLPYYVASRGLRQLQDFKDALLAFTLAAMVLALIGLFEYARHWLLYRALLGALDIDWGLMGYLGRGGSLRAAATTGQAIALGYVLAVAIGFYLFLQASTTSRLQRWLGSLLLTGGLFASLSRGPWIGAAVILTSFIASGRQAFKRLFLLALAGLFSLPLLLIIPGGQKLLDLLPFIGSVEKENITYRERLIDNSLIVIERNPWFGSVDYRRTPEMQSMIQGEGIVDVVNTYLGVALETGLVGLTLFTAFFVTILQSLRRAIRRFPPHHEEARTLGRALLATLCGILVIIFTVSSISIIPVVYWSVAGIAVAYVQWANLQNKAPAKLDR